MAVITISRQYGSGGSDIARRVAARLGWELIDNQFVDRVAERAGMDPVDVERHEERVPSLVERLAQALAISSPEVFVATAEPPEAVTHEDRIVEMTERVIAEAVQHGDVVMVGRGAQAYLAEWERTLHTYIVAPRAARIAAVMQRLAVDEDEAARTVDDIDKNRERYVKSHYKRQWGHPANYHLCLNSEALGYDGCAEAVAEAAKVRKLL
jgi:cytidylate kinase